MKKATLNYIIRGNACPSGIRFLVRVLYFLFFLQRILIKLRRFCKFGMINCTMDAIFCVSVKIVDFVLVKREKGPFHAGVRWDSAKNITEIQGQYYSLFDRCLAEGQ